MHNFTNYWQLQHQGIDFVAEFLRFLMHRLEKKHRATNGAKYNPPPLLHELREVNDHLCECRQVAANAFEKRFKLRHNKYQ